MIAKYQVKQSSDGIGYYVVEMVPGIGEMYILGTSLIKQEMIALAKQLNEEAAE